MNIIIDTNIIFSALIRNDNKFRNEILFNDSNKYFSTRFMMVEIFKHKEKIAKLTKLSEVELLEVFYDLIKNIEFFNEKFIKEANFKKAYDLVKDTDINDIVFVALTLELNGKLWSGDKKLTESLKRKGFFSIYDI